MFDAADKSVEAVTQEKVDFGLFAVDPVCGAGILLTVPYILIEGAYLVKEDSPVQKTSKSTRVTIELSLAKIGLMTYTRRVSSSTHILFVPSPRSPWWTLLWSWEPMWRQA